MPQRTPRLLHHLLEIVSIPEVSCSAIPVSFLWKNPAQQTVKAANDTSTANSVAFWRDTEKTIVSLWMDGSSTTMQGYLIPISVVMGFTRMQNKACSGGRMYQPSRFRSGSRVVALARQRPTSMEKIVLPIYARESTNFFEPRILANQSSESSLFVWKKIEKRSWNSFCFIKKLNLRFFRELNSRYRFYTERGFNRGKSVETIAHSKLGRDLSQSAFWVPRSSQARPSQTQSS